MVGRFPSRCLILCEFVIHDVKIHGHDATDGKYRVRWEICGSQKTASNFDTLHQPQLIFQMFNAYMRAGCESRLFFSHMTQLSKLSSSACWWWSLYR